MKLTHGDKGEPRIDLSDERPMVLVDQLLELIRGNPEFVYQRPETAPGLTGCVYQHGDAPSCLIGRWLHELGVPVKDLKTLDEIPNLEIWYDPDDPESERLGDTGIDQLISFEIVTLPEGFDPDVLLTAQSEQDSGTAWGHVLDDYHATL